MEASVLVQTTSAHLDTLATSLQTYAAALLVQTLVLLGKEAQVTVSIDSVQRDTLAISLAIYVVPQESHRHSAP